MPALYVPLVVNFFEDDRVADCPPLAQLLYVRGLCAAKRGPTDGWLTARQLTALGQGMTHVRRYADRLVELGLWETDGQRWYITAWLKYNQTTDDQAEGGMAGAHKRWHLKRRKPNPTCELCVREGLIT